MPTPDLAALTANIVILVVLAVAPIFIPPEALPAPVRILGYLFPPTHAAAAVRLALAGTLGTTFYTHVAALAATTAIGIAIVARVLRWRA